MPGYQDFALYLAIMMVLWMFRKRGFLEVFSGLAFLVAYLSFFNRWVAVAAVVAPLLVLYLRRSSFVQNKFPTFLVLAVYYWLVVTALSRHFGGF
jgi:hypothetical protein